ncbi:MAG: MMPL family transporter [Gammaproteobacteria bacterium]|nr:MMPL family transporter [Gammaproteobacteria bacterium]
MEEFMLKLRRLSTRAYGVLLDSPRLVLGVLAGLLVVAAFETTRFSFDASSDTLVVQGDPDLAAYLDVAESFRGDDFLLLTFTPHTGAALAEENLSILTALAARMLSIRGVTSVFSVLDAPLLKSPPIPLTEIAEGFLTLRSPDVDRQLAREELSTSPLFKELLITTDGRTTAMRLDLAADLDMREVEQERNRLRALTSPSQPQLAELERTEDEYRRVRARYLLDRDRLIADIRTARNEFTEFGVLYLGGVPMIAADMIAFVKNDLIYFGISVLALVMFSLYGFFRNWRWVVLPIAGGALTIIFTTGVLGYVGRPATVISSNFVSLLAIIAISLNIHLIVRYRELYQLDSSSSVQQLVRETMLSKFAPCIYNSLTTIAAFGSLMASSIVPVEDFGWMMCLGIALGFVVTFTFFPCMLLILSKGNPGFTNNVELGFTRVLSKIARLRPKTIVATGAALTVIAFFGVNQVGLDNRFIDYFQDDTEIYEGMSFIDRNLGGTLPFDVVLEFPPYEAQPVADEEDDFDDFADAETVDPFPERYWFTRDKLDKVAGVHRYLESRPEIGKVLSLTTLEDLASEFFDEEKLSNLAIAGILGLLPTSLRRELIEPFANPADGRLRINVRVVESGPTFDRSALVADIKAHALEEVKIEADAIQVTGMMVLFNGMLAQLFASQVDTLMYVLLVTFGMFVVLLRSLLYALLGLLPNILAASLVVAFMGYAGIPLDMMTITIAAISIGIGVDNAIHYLHRFREEYDRTGDAREAVARTHGTIGRAMYFTGLAVVIGFSVLAFSNFVPTILFGLLVAIAMVFALIANLTLLPALLILFLGGKQPATPDTGVAAADVVADRS